MIQQQWPGAVYTAEQMRELDRLAMDQNGLAAYELMCRAGQALFEVITHKFPRPASVCVLCGGGNNGGDGLVVARLLQQEGWDVTVCLLASPESLKGPAALALKDWQQCGDVSADGVVQVQASPDVIVDALFGTGLDRVIEGSLLDLIETVNRSGAWVVAADIPSGLSADTGSVWGAAIRADQTVTFIGMKRGLLTAQGVDYCGSLAFDDLGVSPRLEAYSPIVKRITDAFVRETLPSRRRSSHKGESGHLLIIGGAAGMSGAVRLAGEAALRSGAGLVSIATHPESVVLVGAGRPELMVHGVCSADVLQRLIHQADAVVIGPGLSQNEWSGLLFATLLGKQRKYVDKPMLVDADGLNLLAQREDRLEACRPKNWILTPHPGEAARLLHTTIEEVQSDRFAAATRLAQAYQANILIKGAGSIVCHSEGEMRLCDQGNPGMATAGMGDVLAGMVGALLCQGLEPFDALSAGVMLHAQAADRVALQGGERGMIASDLFSEIRIGVNPCR